MVRSSDVLVIGAGIVGCAVAHELASRGVRVSVLDSRAPGSGATQSSGGMLAPYSEAADGGALLGLGERSLGLFDSFIERVEAESDTPTHYARSGTLHVARTPGAVDRLRRTSAHLTAAHVPCEWVPMSDIRQREPAVTDTTCGGLFIGTQGLVSAPALTRALAAAAQRRGATFLAAAQARRVVPRETSGIEVVTDRERMTAGAVVLAAGAWSGLIQIEGAEPRVPVKPIRGQLLHLGWDGRTPSQTVWDDRCYVVPWPDRTVLVGATVEDVGFDERTTVSGVRDLLAAVTDLLPPASAAQVLSTRAGLRPATPDGLPVIGWSAVVPGLMYATGHYRNGVLLAPLTARVVADVLLDDATDPALELTTPSRFGRL